MFTGIVEETGKVISAASGKLTVTAEKVLVGIELGGSISVNGACLTATSFTSSSFTVDVMEETLRRTNIGLLHSGDIVNLERPVTPTGLLGGHLVQGHVDGTGRVVSVTPEGGALLVRFEAPEPILRYCVEKGFIAVDGISLTIAGRDSKTFTVSVVQFTGAHTTLQSRRTGDVVNIEVDIIAKYVERLAGGGSSGGITSEFLRENGFIVN